MVTIDNTILNVGEFNGDLTRGRLDYERAKQGLERIGAEAGALEGALKEYTGFSNMDLPTKQTVTVVQEGDVIFTVTSEKRTKRPRYKDAVTGMENYLNGISCLVSQGREISGVVQQGRSIFVSVDQLLEAYDLVVAGIMIPEVKHTIRYELGGALAEEEAQDGITLREGRDPSALNEENFVLYARMDAIRENLEAFVGAYEKELAKGQRGPERTRTVSQKAAFTTKKSTSVGTDWAYVVQTLVTVPTQPDQEGELNALADPGVSMAQKQRDMPEYNMRYIDNRAGKQLYVSIQTVYDRIQMLKAEQDVQSKRLKVEAKAVV